MASKRRRSESLSQTSVLQCSLDVRFQTEAEKEAFIARIIRVRDLDGRRPSLRGVRTGCKPIPRFVLVKPDVIVMNNINLSGVT